MTTVYQIRGFIGRQTISIAIAALVFMYGLWEFYRSADGGDSMALMFGIIFCAGGVYAFHQVRTDSRDNVAKLETDAEGRIVLTLWRPTGTFRLQAEPGTLTDWQYYIKIQGRGGKRRFLMVTHPEHPNRLQIELRPDIVITDALKALAPEAMAEHEAALAGIEPAA